MPNPPTAKSDRDGARPASGAPESLAAGPRLWAAAAGLFVLTLVVFLPLRHAEFLNYDDDIYVTHNPHTLAGITWRGAVWALTNAEFNWHPVTWLSHMLDCQLFGVHAGAHHLMSVLYHGLNAVLLLYLLFRATGALGRSAVVAALFAVHPLHVESVAWVSERKDLLSALFWLAAILAYVRFVERRTLRRYLAVCACMALSLLSKGMAVTLPFTLLLFDFWPLRRWPAQTGGGTATEPCAGRTVAREKLPLLCLAGTGAAVAVVAQNLAAAIAPISSLGLTDRLANALASYAAYAQKMVWPSGLVIPYPIREGLLRPEQLILSAIFLILASTLVARRGRTHGYLVTGWLWYLITLLPVIGLVQIGHQAMADRYTYVPLIGLFLMVVWGAADAAARWPALQRAMPSLGVAAVLTCAVLARLQVGYWHDNVTLFEHTLSVTPINPWAHNSLGVAHDVAGRLDEAEAHYTEALRTYPQHHRAHGNLGVLLARRGNLAEAEAHLTEALRLDPRFVGARLNLGRLRLLEGRAGDAAAEYARAVEIEPRNVTARLGLAEALDAAGRGDEAIEQLREARRLATDGE